MASKGQPAQWVFLESYEEGVRQGAPQSCFFQGRSGMRAQFDGSIDRSITYIIASLRPCSKGWQKTPARK